MPDGEMLFLLETRDSAGMLSSSEAGDSFELDFRVTHPKIQPKGPGPDYGDGGGCGCGGPFSTDCSCGWDC